LELKLLGFGYLLESVTAIKDKEKQIAEVSFL
jgi:hypothetical protein